MNAASYTVNSNTKITAVTKAHALGPVDVVVTSTTGSSLVVAADVYTYYLVATTFFTPYVFPSPTTGDTADVAYFMETSGLVTLRVYNEIGRLVENFEVSKPADTQGSTINTGNMAPGVYYCLLTMKYDDGTVKRYSKIKFAVIH